MRWSRATKLFRLRNRLTSKRRRACKLSPNRRRLDWLGDHQVEAPINLEPAYPAANIFEETAETDEAEEAKKSARGIAAAPETTLVSGVLGEMRKLRTGH